MNHDGAVLRVDGFRVQFPQLAMEAGFHVSRGERLVISGASGSGKTTIFRFMAGLEVEGLESGRILLGAADLTGIPPERRSFGVLFQEAQVFPSLSVFENAAFGLRVRGVGMEERRRQVEPWLERAGLSRAADTAASSLSGGEKQRLALVRALVWRPEALLLDEPFSALDPGLRREMGDWLLELHRDHPVPLVLVTHDEEEAARIGTRILPLQVDGRVHRWIEA